MGAKIDAQRPAISDPCHSSATIVDTRPQAAPVQAMNTNRYAPPFANVDEPSDEPRAPRPMQVVWALRLLWASTVLSIPETWFEATHAPSTPALIVGVALEAIMIAIACYLFVCIHRGRNWARIVTLIFTVLSTAVVVFGPPLPDRSTLDQACVWINTVSDIVSMGLLFMPASSSWFRKQAGQER